MDTPCADLLKSWQDEDIKLQASLATILENKTKWAEEQLWYDAIQSWYEKIKKANDAPPAIDIALTEFGTEAAKLSTAANNSFNSMKTYLAAAMEAFNQAEEAMLSLKPLEAAANAILALEKDIKKEDVKEVLFRDSEIKKILDTIFASHLDMKDKLTKTLGPALDPLKNALALKNDTGDFGLGNLVSQMKTYVSNCKNSGSAYFTSTTDEWTKAKSKMDVQNQHYAERDLRATLTGAYRAAMEVKKCPPPSHATT
jgi:hypothetical protein